MRKFSIIKLIAFLFILVGQNYAQPDSIATYFPLEVGNIWQYKVTRILQDDTSQSGYEFIEVMKDTLIEGNKYYKTKMLSRWPVHFEYQIISYLRWDPNESHIIEYGSDTIDTFLSFKEPLSFDTVNVFGEERPMITLWWQRVDFPNYTLKFIKNIGCLYYRDDETWHFGRDWIVYDLVYAKINGTEYGTYITSIDEDIHSPIFYSLSQNYPNPFNPTTTIRYSISERSFVKMIIYNMLGEEIKELVAEEKSPATYEINFDGSMLTSGIYIYHLETNKFNYSRKMILLK